MWMATSQGCWPPSPELMGTFFFFFLSFTATPGAYGNSQARDRIRAAAAGLRHSNSDPSCICDLCLSLEQPWILNPLSKAGD